MPLYVHTPHPHIAQRRQASPEQLGLNSRIGARITALVGTMTCAYLFLLLALPALPAAIQISSLSNPIPVVTWLAQTCLQLVLLPIILVGQAVQGRAAEKRAVDTYNDAEAVLKECLDLQRHLQEQDVVLERVLAHIAAHPPVHHKE